MKRIVARGRVFPQSYSTDRRYGRLSLQAGFLFPMVWANADDQGRLCGDPEEVKYAVCPNIDHITKSDIPEILDELQRNNLIKVYETPKSAVIQLLDWWEIHRPQWAYPSEYPPPEGWKDRLRYHPTPKEIVTENWVPPSQFNRELPSNLPRELPSNLPRELPSNLPRELPSKLESEVSHTLPTEKEKEEGRRNKEDNVVNYVVNNNVLPSNLAPTTTENVFLDFLSKLKNWKFEKDDDLNWLRDFSQQEPKFSIALAKECRDWHSGRAPPKHKGIWKTRFRNWMTKKQEFDKGGKRRPGRVPTEAELDAQERERGLR